MDINRRKNFTESGFRFRLDYIIKIRFILIIDTCLAILVIFLLLSFNAPMWFVTLVAVVGFLIILTQVLNISFLEKFMRVAPPLLLYPLGIMI